MGWGKNAANPIEFASILTKPQREILIPKSDSGLNALANEDYYMSFYIISK